MLCLGMTIVVASNSEVESVLQLVKAWPAESRIALARRVLESIEQESSTSGLKGESSDRILGIWSTGEAAPSDEECDRILAEELERKHAS